MQINSRSVFEIGFLFDRVHRPVAPWAAVWLPSAAGAGVRCWVLAGDGHNQSAVRFHFNLCLIHSALCVSMYVFITVHVQRVGVCWCVCAIGDAIFVLCDSVRACLCRWCESVRVDVVSAFGLLSFSSFDNVANYVMSSLMILILS